MKWKVPLALVVCALGAFGALRAAAQADDGGAPAITEKVTCCVTSGNCRQVDDESVCEQLILAQPEVAGEGGEELAEPREFKQIDAPSHIDPRPDAAEILVDSCEDLPKDKAPIPEGATALEGIRWYACSVHTADSCGNVETFNVAWPRYSDGHLEGSPVHRDPWAGGLFRAVLGQEANSIWVKAAENIDAPSGAACD